MNIIIILGNKLQRNGEMDKILTNRLDKAIGLFNKYTYIIVSGGKVRSIPPGHYSKILSNALFP